jgi:hypothetical protein
MSYDYYNFPSETTLRQCICGHSLFNGDALKGQKITKTITDLSVERLADRKNVNIELETSFMMHDIRNEKDGYTGNPLPRFSYPDSTLTIVSIVTDQVLKDCAIKK